MTCRADGTFGPCEGEVTPTNDVCDGQDNDCDSVTDGPDSCNNDKVCVEGECKDCQPGDSRACYTGPDGTAGVGICQRGTETCNANGNWGSCEGEVTPTNDVCDGRDNNCDGEVDRPDSCTGGKTCVNGICRCPNLQQDCGGTCTNTIGAPCNTGRPGICAQGTIRCPDGTLRCVENQGPRPEVCNGVDDDCNGQVDNGAICPGDKFCQSGQCVCPSGSHDCSGNCVSNNDVRTCGNSCFPCQAPNNGTATCNGTSCGFTCNTGFTPCGGACCQV